MGGDHCAPPSRADNWLVDTGDHDAQSGGLSNDFGKVGGRGKHLGFPHLQNGASRAEPVAGTHWSPQWPQPSSQGVLDTWPAGGSAQTPPPACTSQGAVVNPRGLCQ